MSLEVDLEGAIDLHVHTAPDVEPRCVDDWELTQAAAEAGMRAVLIKSHYALTADRAWLVERMTSRIRVFGGLTLNEAVGGLNPAAVEAALKLGARAIWMPTRSAANHKAFFGEPGLGLSILSEEEKLKAEVYEILGLIAEFDVILATGHLSPKEIMALIPAAHSMGVRKIVITHPELPVVNLSIAAQRDLARAGVFFERCYVSTLLPGSQVTLGDIAKAIREVGPEHTVLASDLGQKGNPHPVAGFGQYIDGLRSIGMGQQEIDVMIRRNPALLLSI